MNAIGYPLSYQYIGSGITPLYLVDPNIIINQNQCQLCGAHKKCEYCGNRYVENGKCKFCGASV
jgi:hypothetical protein